MTHHRPATLVDRPSYTWPVLMTSALAAVTVGIVLVATDAAKATGVSLIAVAGIVVLAKPAALVARAVATEARLKTWATICGWLAWTTGLFGATAFVGVTAGSGGVPPIGVLTSIAALAAPTLFGCLWFLLRRSARQRRLARLQPSSA